jgi:hypothetical protein
MSVAGSGRRHLLLFGSVPACPWRLLGHFDEHTRRGRMARLNSLLLLAACDSGGPTEPQNNPVAVAGHYTLRTIEDQPLPHGFATT